MKRFFSIFILLLAVLNLSVFAQNKKIAKLEIKEAITPVTERYIQRGITLAENESYDAILFILDTPGGLLETTRNIVQLILATKLDTIVYVSPRGSRAGSAGVFITISAKYAAMAPGCNIGAAHPVDFGGSSDDDKNRNSKILAQKIENDTVAFIEGIAKTRNRNIEWAMKSVKESVSITSDDALAKKVIDFIAEDDKKLLKEIYGVEKEFEIKEVAKTWAEGLLTILANPNIAYFLLVLGFIGIVIEFINPGTIFSGVLGALFLITALFSLQSLPINFAGILLLILAFVMFILEIFITSYGLLSVGGIISLIMGSAMLFDTNLPFFKVSALSIGVMVILAAGLAFLIVFYARKMVIKKAVSGKEGMLEMEGVAFKDFENGKGKIHIHGEIWNAISTKEIKKNDIVKVKAINGLTLTVE